MSHSYEPPVTRYEMHLYVHIDDVTVSVGGAGTDAGNTAILAAIAQLSTKVDQMSQTLSQQLDAATTAVETDVAAVAAEVTALLASMTPGSQITQAQVDRVTAIDTAMKAIPPQTPVVIQPTP